MNLSRVPGKAILQARGVPEINHLCIADARLLALDVKMSVDDTRFSAIRSCRACVTTMRATPWETWCRHSGLN